MKLNFKRLRQIMALFANKANKAHNRKEMKLWIARDADGDLWMFGGEPTKIGNMWRNKQEYFGRFVLQLSADQFLEVQWEDDEPTEVELKTVKK